MNEQALADLLSEHIDRLLAGELNAEVPTIADLPELATLSHKLSQITFQPGPTAQAAFQSQVDEWFGSDTPPTSKMLTLPNGVSGSIVIVTGLIIVAGSIFFGGFSEAEQLEPATMQPIVSPSEPTVRSTPEIATTPTPVAPTQTPVPVTPTSTSSQPVTSLGDPLPTPQPSLGETLPLLTPAASPPHSPAPTSVSGHTDSDDSPPDNDNLDDNPLPANQPGEGNTVNQGNNDGPTPSDHDRGHGNDPGRFDQDNPGQGSGDKSSGGGDRGGGSKGGGGKGGRKKGK